MANQKYGRDLLCIDKNFPKIIEISKKHITGHLGFEKLGKDAYLHKKISDFRIGAKWANIIRNRWPEFQAYAQEYYSLVSRPVLFPVLPQFGFAYTTSTFYPDPNPETNTVDGNTLVLDDVSGYTWANAIAAAGDAANDSELADWMGGIFSFTTSPEKWERIYRSIFGFDTSSIPDTDTISSATFSIAGNGTAESDNFGQSLVLDHRAQPASATAVAAGDYASASWDGVVNSAWFDITNWVQTDGTYNDLALNATGLGNISKTVASWFGIRSGNGTTIEADPTASGTLRSGVISYFADQAGTTSDPKLVVVHAVATSTTYLSTLLLMNIG